jgi:hypothetical protein
MTWVDDTFGIRRDRAVDEDIAMVLGPEPGADGAIKGEVGEPRPLALLSASHFALKPLPIIRLARLRSMFVHPLPTDRAEVTLPSRRFSADPCPDAHGEYEHRSGRDRDEEKHASS